MAATLPVGDERAGLGRRDLAALGAAGRQRAVGLILERVRRHADDPALAWLVDVYLAGAVRRAAAGERAVPDPARSWAAWLATQPAGTLGAADADSGAQPRRILLAFGWGLRADGRGVRKSDPPLPLDELHRQLDMARAIVRVEREIAAVGAARELAEDAELAEALRAQTAAAERERTAARHALSGARRTLAMYESKLADLMADNERLRARCEREGPAPPRDLELLARLQRDAAEALDQVQADVEAMAAARRADAGALLAERAQDQAAAEAQEQGARGTLFSSLFASVSRAAAGWAWAAVMGPDNGDDDEGGASGGSARAAVGAAAGRGARDPLDTACALAARIEAGCARCYAPAAASCCSRCRRARYCGAACQRAHWAAHRAGGCRAAVGAPAAAGLHARRVVDMDAGTMEADLGETLFLDYASSAISHPSHVLSAGLRVETHVVQARAPPVPGASDRHSVQLTVVGGDPQRITETVRTPWPERDRTRVLTIRVRAAAIGTSQPEVADLQRVRYIATGFLMGTTHDVSIHFDAAAEPPVRGFYIDSRRSEEIARVVAPQTVAHLRALLADYVRRGVLHARRADDPRPRCCDVGAAWFVYGALVARPEDAPALAALFLALDPGLARSPGGLADAARGPAGAEQNTPPVEV